MNTHGARTLEINELVMRVTTGLDRSGAAELGEAVAQILARELSLTTMFEVPKDVAVSVRVPRGLAGNDLAEAIAAQIVVALS